MCLVFICPVAVFDNESREFVHGKIRLLPVNPFTSYLACFLSFRFLVFFFVFESQPVLLDGRLFAPLSLVQALDVSHIGCSHRDRQLGLLQARRLGGDRLRNARFGQFFFGRSEAVESRPFEYIRTARFLQLES